METIKIERKDHWVIIGGIAINTYFTPIVSIVIVDEDEDKNDQPIPYLDIRTSQTTFTMRLTEENKQITFNELLECLI